MLPKSVFDVIVFCKNFIKVSMYFNSNVAVLYICKSVLVFACLNCQTRFKFPGRIMPIFHPNGFAGFIPFARTCFKRFFGTFSRLIIAKNPAGIFIWHHRGEPHPAGSSVLDKLRSSDLQVQCSLDRSEPASCISGKSTSEDPSHLPHKSHQRED